MKKATKILITAAAVAAVAGVGAVSYAAWSGSAASTATVNGSAGVMATHGEIVVTPETGTGTWDADSKTVTMSKALFPNDQDSVPTDGAKFWKFTVTTPTTGDATVTYKMSGTMTAATQATTGAALHWSATEPSGKTTADTTNVLSGTATSVTLGTDGVIYVYLTADNTAAMGATIELSITAE